MFEQVIQKKPDILAYLESLGIPTNKVQNEELLLLFGIVMNTNE
ncbi:MAG: hypothetical protein NT085_04310 [candidate division SR1 bacterium]|nr:hypothetical protein [candidate division SR1 bacterium]